MPGSFVVHIVDDDEAVRKSLAFLLSTAGIPIRVYESATSFLAGLSTLQDGCLITDVRMPDMTGIELLQHLRGKGLVGFSACSHAGIVNVLHHARTTFPRIPLHAVMGGFHLSGPTEAIIPETVRDLGQMGWKLLSDKEITVSGRDALLIEYEGTMPGQQQMLRFIGLAVCDADKQFTVTATSLKESFGALEKDMRASIESFRLPGAK